MQFSFQAGIKFVVLVSVLVVMLASAFSSSLRRAQVVPRVTGARFMGGKASSSAFQVSSKTRRRATAIGTILVSMAAADLAQSSLQSSRGSSRGLAACAAEAGGADRWAASALFPAIMPYEQGMLKVSDIHTIAYFVYGNPTGKPVLVVHGGPGSGTTHGKPISWFTLLEHNQSSIMNTL